MDLLVAPSCFFLRSILAVVFLLLLAPQFRSVASCCLQTLLFLGFRSARSKLARSLCLRPLAIACDRFLPSLLATACCCCICFLRPLALAVACVDVCTASWLTQLSSSFSWRRWFPPISQPLGQCALVSLVVEIGSVWWCGVAGGCAADLMLYYRPLGPHLLACSPPYYPISS